MYLPRVDMKIVGGSRVFKVVDHGRYKCGQYLVVS